jgi:hypothetical protein
MLRLRRYWDFWPSKTGLNFPTDPPVPPFSRKKTRNRTPERSFVWRDVSKGDFP